MKPTIERGSQTLPGRSKKTLFSQFIQQWDLQMFVWFSLIALFIFQYIPMSGVLMAFQDYDLFKGFFGSKWVGFKHFEAFFHAPDFWQIMWNTICIRLLKLILGFPAPIVLSLMLNEVGHRWFKRTIQTISYPLTSFHGLSFPAWSFRCWPWTTEASISCWKNST